MATTKSSGTVFICDECGTVERKWHGQCPGCGSWNTMVEESAQLQSAIKATRRGIGLRAAPPAGAAKASSADRPILEPVVLSEVRASRIRRITTGIGEFDRVLGGSEAAGSGIVPGSLVLLGGAPGIGKSTLVGAALGNLVHQGTPVLYVSGEESPEQIRLRHERLGASALDVPLLAETDVDLVIAAIEGQPTMPAVCVIDSVQTLYCSEFSGAPGSVGQVREVANRLMQVAKTRGIAMLLIGHVTKEGSLAGPRVLEHLVDCVLHFEGERERSFRTLRAAKNRFGSTNEIGVFEMERSGLVEIEDASSRFIGDATGNPGSVIVSTIEGTRPMLIEIQALVARTEVAPPRRVTNGIDRNRLALVLAVLAKHAGLALGDHDVFVNVVGGVRIDEPGADLAVALAVASAARNEPLAASTDDPNSTIPLVCFGEVGLTGELRPVSQPDRRVAEAVKFGLNRMLLPAGSDERGGIHTVREALSSAFG